MEREVRGKTKGLRQGERLLLVLKMLVGDRNCESGISRERRSSAGACTGAGNGSSVRTVAARLDGRCSSSAATREGRHAERKQDEGCERTDKATASDRNKAKQHRERSATADAPSGKTGLLLTGTCSVCRD